jgi:hypothetical protein
MQLNKIFSVSVLAMFVLFIDSCSHKTAPIKTTVETEAPTPIDNYTVTLNSNYGKEIFESKCGSCHDLNKPSDYTFKEWNPIMNKMAKKADLDYMQKQNVLGYLKDNAKAEK